MTVSANSLREHDSITVPPPRPAIDLTPFAGIWRKTNEGSQWIDHVIVRIDGESLFVQVAGSSSPSPADWGVRRADAIYASGIESSRGMAFLARFSLDHCNVELEANVNLGLMIAATFVRWKDGSRADTFTREFFYRSDV
jgi:hypothetical protein